MQEIIRKNGGLERVLAQVSLDTKDKAEIVYLANLHSDNILDFALNASSERWKHLSSKQLSLACHGRFLSLLKILQANPLIAIAFLEQLGPVSTAVFIYYQDKLPSVLQKITNAQVRRFILQALVSEEANAPAVRNRTGFHLFAPDFSIFVTLMQLLSYEEIKELMPNAHFKTAVAGFINSNDPQHVKLLALFNSLIRIKLLYFSVILPS